jgi:MazG family protein
VSAGVSGDSARLVLPAYKNKASPQSGTDRAGLHGNSCTRNRPPERFGLLPGIAVAGFILGMEKLHPSRDIAGLLELMARLRDPEAGCPWDKEQTFATIAPYTIEEAYEVAAAIEDGDPKHLKEELGDLLFQVVFHSRMAEERGLFGFQDVVATLVEKMVARHPHVFADVDQPGTAAAQTDAWEALKARERAAKEMSILDDVPRALPALMRAEKLQKRASKVGFDWDSAPKVVEKLTEEATEICEAQAEGAGPEKLEEEVGDLLFVVANLARHLKVDPEKALRVANAKFVRRFGYIERELKAKNRSCAEASLDEMEALWVEAKTKEKPV